MRKDLIFKGASALRDFFAAVNADDLKSASIDIADRFKLPLDEDKDWVEVEYDFNRLFVGPAAIPAPPYASAYQKEPTLMGAAALDVRKAYALMGLAVPDQGSMPDDHLAFELDAVSSLFGASEPLSDEDRDLISELKHWLVEEHLAGWVPKFVEAIAAQEDVTVPVRNAVLALAAWLNMVRVNGTA